MDARLIGVDCIFDKEWEIAVVETQVFTDFPDTNYFDLAKHLTDRVVSMRPTIKPMFYRAQTEP